LLEPISFDQAASRSSMPPLRLPHFPLAEGLGQRHSALA
jgi:hypothetical protein